MTRRDHRLLLVLLVVAVAYYGSFFDVDLNPSDEGYLVYGVQRTLDGQLPGTDFHAYEPGRYWLLAPFFAVFGSDVVVARAVLLVHRVAIVLLVLVAARRFLPPLAALVPTLTVLVLPGPWHKSWFSLFLLAALVLAERHLAGDDSDPRRLVLGGGLIGLATVFRLDLGVFSALLWAVAVLARRRRWPRQVAILGAAAVLPPAAAGAWYAAHGGLGAALRFYLGEYVNASGDLERIHPKIAGFPDPLAALASFPERFFEVAIWAALASAAVLATVVMAHWRRERTPPWPLVLLGAGWASAALAVVVQPDRSHVLQNGPMLYLAGTVAVVELERLLRPRTRPWLGATAAALILVTLVAESLFAPGVIPYYTGSMRMAFGPRQPAHLPHASVELAPWVAEEYHDLVGFITATTGPGDGVATCFCLPMLNLMAERPNPTGLDILFPHTIARPDQQARYLAALADVDLLVANACELDHDRPERCPPDDHTLADFAPAVVEHLHREWEPVHTSVHGFAVVYGRRAEAETETETEAEAETEAETEAEAETETGAGVG